MRDAKTRRRIFPYESNVLQRKERWRGEVRTSVEKKGCNGIRFIFKNFIP